MDIDRVQFLAWVGEHEEVAPGDYSRRAGVRQAVPPEFDGFVRRLLEEQVIYSTRISRQGRPLRVALTSLGMAEAEGAQEG